MLLVTMFNKIFVILLLFIFFTLCSCDDGKVLEDLDLSEGADCEWVGVKGKCVKETRCFTTLDKRGDPHPVCSTKGDEKIVCCTDCELINSTRNVVLSPRSDYLWKDGTKARDNCLDYLSNLPYECRWMGGYYTFIRKEYIEEKKCHSISLGGIGGAPAIGQELGIKYPHQALLGFGYDVDSAKWEESGTIISNKFILTAAHIGRLLFQAGPLKYVALGIKKITDDPAAWQTHKVKRFFRHPDYKQFSLYNDIALIETEDTITFNINVLPACLPFEVADDEKAIYTTWVQLDSAYTADAGVRAQTVHVDKFSEDECKVAYSPFKMQFSDGIDYEKQMCYGTKEQTRIFCKGNAGEPLLLSTVYEKCMHMVIGVMSFGRSQCGSKRNFPDVYTKVAYYKPWIESVVWP